MDDKHSGPQAQVRLVITVRGDTFDFQANVSSDVLLHLFDNWYALVTTPPSVNAQPSIDALTEKLNQVNSALSQAVSLNQP